MGYQGYKRKISSMSNEEFNKLNMSQFGMDEMRKLTANTPTMEAMFAEMRPMVDIMAKELGNLLRSIPDLVGQIINEPAVTPAPGGPQGALKPGIPGFITPIVIPNPEQFIGGGGIPPPPPAPTKLPSGSLEKAFETIRYNQYAKNLQNDINIAKTEGDWRLRVAAKHKAWLTDIAHMINNITATYIPIVKRKKSQSSDIALNSLVTTMLATFTHVNSMVEQIQSTGSQKMKTSTGRQLQKAYEARMENYRDFQKLIARHLRTYIL